MADAESEPVGRREQRATEEAAFDKALEAKERFETLRKKIDSAMAALEQDIEALRAQRAKDWEADAAELRALSPLPLAAGNRAPPTLRAAYSDRTAALMAKFAWLAYKEFRTPNEQALLSTILHAAGFTLVGCFQREDTEAFIAKNEDFCVLAFRGTDTPASWNTNRRMRKKEIPGHPARVRAHEGFLDAFLLVEAEVRATLRSETDGLPVYVTGHSLGGALALIAGAVLGGLEQATGKENLGDRIAAVYTFGAPRVGDETFEVSVKAPHYRIVNQRDIVPWVPPTWMRGYRHSGDVRILNRPGQRPQTQQTSTSIALFALVMALQWMLGIAYLRRIIRVRLQARGMLDHDMKRYVTKLDRISENRQMWR